MEKVEQFTSTIKQLHHEAVIKSKLLSTVPKLPQPVPKDANVAPSSSHATDERESEAFSQSYKNLKERNRLLKKAKQTPEYKYFEERTNMFKKQEIPCTSLKIDQEVWVVMLEKALSKMRQNMKFATDEAQWKQFVRHQIADIKKGEAYQSVASFSLTRPKTPDIDLLQDLLLAKEQIKEWKKAVFSEKKKLMMPLSQRITMDLKEVKQSDVYLDYTKLRYDRKVSRVKTPDTFAVLTLSDWETAHISWKKELDQSVRNPLKSTRDLDVQDLKKSELYLEYSKAQKNGQIRRPVKSPDPREYSSSSHRWEKAYRLWKQELREALEDSRCLSYLEHGHEEAKPIMIKEDVVKEEVDLKIDLKKVACMEAETEMMSYVKSLSINYANAIDQKHSKTRGVLSSLVGDSVPFIPCGAYNKDNSCPDQSTLHSDKNGEKRIHSCVLCYFVLSMINMHRLSKCPLLTYL